MVAFFARPIFRMLDRSGKAIKTDKTLDIDMPLNNTTLLGLPGSGSMANWRR